MPLFPASRSDEPHGPGPQAPHPTAWARRQDAPPAPAPVTAPVAAPGQSGLQRVLRETPEALVPNNLCVLVYFNIFLCALNVNKHKEQICVYLTRRKGSRQI